MWKHLPWAVDNGSLAGATMDGAGPDAVSLSPPLSSPAQIVAAALGAAKQDHPAISAYVPCPAAVITCPAGQGIARALRLGMFTWLPTFTPVLLQQTVHRGYAPLLQSSCSLHLPAAVQCPLTFSLPPPLPRPPCLQKAPAPHVRSARQAPTLPATSAQPASPASPAASQQDQGPRPASAARLGTSAHSCRAPRGAPSAASTSCPRPTRAPACESLSTRVGWQWRCCAAIGGYVFEFRWLRNVLHELSMQPCHSLCRPAPYPPSPPPPSPRPPPPLPPPPPCTPRGTVVRTSKPDGCKQLNWCVRNSAVNGKRWQHSVGDEQTSRCKPAIDRCGAPLPSPPPGLQLWTAVLHDSGRHCSERMDLILQ